MSAFIWPGGRSPGQRLSRSVQLGRGGGCAEGALAGLLGLCAQWPDLDQGEQGLDGCAAGQCSGTEATLPHCPRESQRRQRSSMSTHNQLSFHV